MSSKTICGDLRLFGNGKFTDGRKSIDVLMNEAADEIERLRAQVKAEAKAEDERK